MLNNGAGLFVARPMRYPPTASAGISNKTTPHALPSHVPSSADAAAATAPAPAPNPASPPINPPLPTLPLNSTRETILRGSSALSDVVAHCWVFLSARTIRPLSLAFKKNALIVSPLVKEIRALRLSKRRRVTCCWNPLQLVSILWASAAQKTCTTKRAARTCLNMVRTEISSWADYASMVWQEQDLKILIVMGHPNSGS
jgi:hypothetical protein